MSITQQFQEMAKEADRSAHIKKLMDGARGSAIAAASAIGTAHSWVGYSDVSDDDRDPDEMIATSLERAEKYAFDALAQVRSLRAVLQSSGNALPPERT